MTNTILMQATSGAAQPGGIAVFLFQSFPFLLVFLIFYMLWIRPQQQRVKQHQADIASVKKGDEVVTGGGHIGKVTKVGDHEVEVEFAAGHRHRVVKSMLSDVRPSGGKPAND
jgi:preprotein translocase subunit YajC